MEKLDARRLTGPNVIWQRPSAIIDIAFDKDDLANSVIKKLKQEIKRLAEAVGWQNEEIRHYQFLGGVSVVLSAPIDTLYTAVELLELAWTNVCGETNAGLQSDVDQLRASLKEEQNPSWIALRDAAEEKQVTFIWDDDEISLGLGRGSQTWPSNAVPKPPDVQWSKYHDVPVGLVTGTNGKTTTVRLLTHIMRAANKNVGLSSTDWIAVNDQIIDRGDYSGPGGARAVLRQQQVDVAILETARGGLLRRGLGVNVANAALITNIAEDHLGDFGSQDIQELLNVKWIVADVLREQDCAVLNADDALLVKKSSELKAPVFWFTLNADDKPWLKIHMEEGGQVVALRNGEISHFNGEHWQDLCEAKSIPITMDGIARHNIANALGASAMAIALDINYKDVVKGMTTMTTNDNPGRCNLFHVDGVDVLLDFAHNPEGMAALFDIATHHPAKRRALCFGQAGDRTDRSIRELGQTAWAIGLDKVFISELANYRRGREPGEVYQLLRDEMISRGANENQFEHNEEEIDSLKQALDWAQPGDFIIMLGLASSHTLLEFLQNASTSY